MTTTRDILNGLLITIVGGVIVAWIIREGELFQSKEAEQVAISIVNNDCFSNNLMVDGETVALSIPPKGATFIKVRSGEHWVQSCSTNNPSNCQPLSKLEWANTEEYSIPKSRSCPITITLTNNDCKSSDFYVDGNVAVSNIGEAESKGFEVVPGTHMLKACLAGTDNCGNEHELDWQTSTEHFIKRSSSCTITPAVATATLAIENTVPTITPSLSPTATVFIFSYPTLTPSDEDFGPLSFCYKSELDAKTFQCTISRTVFTSPVSEVCVSWIPSPQYMGRSYKRVWRNKTTGAVTSHEDFNTFGCLYWNREPGLASGQYEVELFANNIVIQKGSFTIRK